jgi:hypothetical protein
VLMPFQKILMHMYLTAQNIQTHQLKTTWITQFVLSGMLTPILSFF